MIELRGLYEVKERKGIRNVIFHLGQQEPLFKTLLRLKPPSTGELFLLFWNFAVEMISNNFKIFMVSYVSLKQMYF